MRALPIALPLFLLACAAQADEANVFADAMLPEARSWQAFDALAPIKAEELKAKWPELMAAYRASPEAGGWK